VNYLSPSPTFNLGFLTVLQEANGYLGGYLATNAWGRPLEFRLGTAVQPNRVQQILYGPTLRPYICADLIGKTLVEKTTTAVQVIVTDFRPVLELRRSIEIPVAWLCASGARYSPASTARGEAGLDSDDVPQFLDCGDAHAPALSLPAVSIFCHPQFTADKTLVCRLIERLTETLDLAEPFARIREAIGEARKMSVIKPA
jgi:hypothetical protein